MRRFNEECPDVPGVRYFSWGAVYDPGLIDTWKCVCLGAYFPTYPDPPYLDGHTP